MSKNWKTTGVRGELTNDRVFVENTETGQTGSVITSRTNDQDLRNQQTGEAIAKGEIRDLTPPKS